jgi:hypothetical protein
MANKKRRWGVFTGPPGGIEKTGAARTGVLERAWMDVMRPKDLHGVRTKK